MCLLCLFLIRCIEQARSFRELSLAEGGLKKAPMLIALPWVNTSDYLASQLLLWLSISTEVRLSCTWIKTPPRLLFQSFQMTLVW